ncbi:hypothetical protein DLR69_03725 [Vibrio paracholerae]|uniref:Uncharacterized protein n=1 Tax=Vibrio paracholerae TaxID=650003 RepID=A0AAX1QY21_9VIBR|nr:hypothetical protein DLR69_03725 [Vibrio paracholerae]RBM84553.1 hypothetical protein DLR70_02340 [Vibrio paracholerae]RBM90104.1 hypothetical protein DLR74_05280 [Vibrio paracholerae]
MLATFVHPNHIVSLCSWGLTHLPPTCNSKLFGYRQYEYATQQTTSIKKPTSRRLFSFLFL